MIPDIFWLLAVRVPEGGSTPFESWLLWHYQFLLIHGVPS